DSWYFDSPMDPTSQYETHIATEVVAFIDGNYRTLATREKRAITGLSMGGHGALFLAIRHPQIFGAAGSMSGGVDIRDSSKKWHLRQKIGSIKEFPQRWDSLTVITNIEKFQDAHLALIIDCGIKDMFLQMNREFHEKLLQAEIPHDYIERPGDHNWKYWNNAVRYQLLFFYEFFQEIPED
ncbi:MAG: esterase family protein, partial [Methanobacteriota archaeon]